MNKGARLVNKSLYLSFITNWNKPYKPYGVYIYDISIILYRNKLDLLLLSFISLSMQ